ncbi:MAG: hypothetical protein KatS3mg103_0497 [Phycisphaerales bacterium]|nr:MAG: hypothetical protein KatS3mg103_0497 [Phycisphaerales bacterium]
MVRRGGFTLIEVMVALGLLVLIASLVVPVALTDTTTARAEAAERMLLLGPAVARGEARQAGRPVALALVERGDGRPLSLAVLRVPGGEDADPARAAPTDPADPLTWPTVAEPQALPEGTSLWEGADPLDDAAPAGPTYQPWAGGGQALVGSSRADGRADPLAMALEGADGAGPAGGPAERAVVLAWFFSDGTAAAGEAVTVRLPDGRLVQVRVQPLHGSVRLQAASAPPPAPPQAGADEASAWPSAVPDATTIGELAGEGQGRTGTEPGFDGSSFGEPGFDELGFDELGFDELGFDESGQDASEVERSGGGLSQDGSTGRGAGGGDGSEEGAVLPQAPLPTGSGGSGGS